MIKFFKPSALWKGPHRQFYLRYLPLVQHGPRFSCCVIRSKTATQTIYEESLGLPRRIFYGSGSFVRSISMPTGFITRSLIHNTQTRGFKIETRLTGSTPGSENSNDTGRTLSRRSIVVKVKDLEKYLRLRGYFALKWVLSLLGLAGFGIYMFREPIKDNLSDEVADVASRSLSDESVVLRANEISKAIVNQVLTDPGTLQLALQFVTQLLQNEQLVDKAKLFVSTVINDNETQASISKLAKSTLQKLIEDKSSQEMILNFVKGIIQDEETRKTCMNLLEQLASDKETKELLAELFKNVLRSDSVTNEAVSLGKNVTKQIVTDRNIQEETGIALWAAVKKTLTPAWLLTGEVKSIP